MSNPHTYAEADPFQLDYIHRHAQVGDRVIIRRWSDAHKMGKVADLRVEEVGLPNEHGYPFNIRLEDGSIISMFKHHDGIAKHMVCPQDQDRDEFAVLRKFIAAIRAQQEGDEEEPEDDEEVVSGPMLDLRIAVDRVFQCGNGQHGTRYTVVDVNWCDHLCGFVKEESSVEIGFVPSAENVWEEDEPDVQDSQTFYEIGEVDVTGPFWDTNPTEDVTRLQ